MKVAERLIGEVSLYPFQIFCDRVTYFWLLHKDLLSNNYIRIGKLQLIVSLTALRDNVVSHKASDAVYNSGVHTPVCMK